MDPYRILAIDAHGLCEPALRRAFPSVVSAEILSIEDVDGAAYNLTDGNYDVVVVSVGTVSLALDATVTELRGIDPFVSVASFSTTRDELMIAMNSSSVDYDLVLSDPPRRNARIVTLAAGRTRMARERGGKAVEDSRILNKMFEHTAGPKQAILDERGRIVAVNEAWKQNEASVSGWFMALSEGMDYLAHAEQYESDEYKELAAGLRSVLTRSRQHHRCDIPVNEDGEDQWYMVNITHQPDAETVIVTHTDITERKQTEEETTHRLLHDGLTGMPNRTMFIDSLQSHLRRRAQTGDSLAVMFIDLDKFKQVNDTLGHAMGDAVLKAAADRIKHACRPNDTAARLAGDEFVVLCANVSEDEAKLVANRIVANVSQPIEQDGMTANVGASVGIAFATEADDTLEALMQRADNAMYQAKRAGRGQTAMGVPTDVGTFSKESLEESISRGDFHVWLQPRWFLSDTRHIACLDMSARLWSQQHGAVSPKVFIPQLEEHSLMSRFGEWAINAVCRQVAVWSARRPCPPVSLNLTVHDLRNPDFVDRVAAALAANGVSPELIRYELAEADMQIVVDSYLPEVRRLHALGVSVSLDDFGSQGMELLPLRDLPVDSLGLDREIVADLDSGRIGEVFLGSLVKFAHSLGMTVFGKGVETERQRDRLAAIGVDYAQGYLLGMPAPASSITEVPEFTSPAGDVQPDFSDIISGVRSL